MSIVFFFLGCLAGFVIAYYRNYMGVMWIEKNSDQFVMEFSDERKKEKAKKLNHLYFKVRKFNMPSNEV